MIRVWGPVEWVGDQFNTYFWVQVERSLSYLSENIWHPMVYKRSVRLQPHRQRGKCHLHSIYNLSGYRCYKNNIACVEYGIFLWSEYLLKFLIFGWLVLYFLHILTEFSHCTKFSCFFVAPCRSNWWKRFVSCVARLIRIITSCAPFSGHLIA